MIEHKSTAGRMLALALGMLLLCVVAGSLAYHYAEGWTLGESFYMVVITLSTVGFREVNPLTPTGRLITVVLIGFGLGALTFFGASVTRLILEGELREVVGKRRMERDIIKLKDHYIVCGFGRVGRVVCSELQKAGVPFLVVDSGEHIREQIEAAGHLWIRGNANEEKTLLEAGLLRSRGLILALPNEADSVYVTLLAKDLHADAFVLARAISDQGDRRLKAAGADLVVSPNIIGGHRMAHAVLRPGIIEFIDIVSGRVDLEELEIRELRVDPRSPLAGTTIGEVDVRRRFGLLVVGQQAPDGSVAFNPAPTDTIEADTHLIVLGRSDDIDRFSAEVAG